jgi:tripartite-type tricarboxylate transporter receptor subunit TctC
MKECAVDKFLKIAVFFSMFVASSEIALTQEFPLRPVRITSPYPSGSGPDIMARLIGDELSKLWKQSVVIEPKPGGDGIVAINSVKSRPKDGYELLFLGNGHLTINPNVKNDLSYDVEKDFAPVIVVYSVPYFVAVSAQSPLHNISDLITAAKKGAGKVSYGSPYVSSPSHLGSALFAHLVGTEMLHVPFKETTQWFTGVARGDVDWSLGTLATMKPMLDSNLLRLLAIARDKRSPDRPDVPTVAEAGGPKGYVVEAWAGFVVMSGTPSAIVQRLNQDIVRVLSDPTIKARIAQLGSEPLPGTPQQMAELIRTDTARYGAIARMIRP